MRKREEWREFYGEQNKLDPEHASAKPEFDLDISVLLAPTQ